jgi:hypothetical protein
VAHGAAAVVLLIGMQIAAFQSFRIFEREPRARERSRSSW